METKKEVYAEDRHQWRKWLTENHSKTDEIWLVFYKKNSGKMFVTYQEAVEEALCFGWIDSLKKAMDCTRYKQRFTPRKKGSIWSESNKKRVDRLIKQGLMTEEGLMLIRQAQKDGSWDKIPDSSKKISPAVEFTEGLNNNESAMEFFESLAPSYQKQFINWIGSAKKHTTRVKRTNESIALLEKNQKLGLK